MPTRLLLVLSLLLLSSVTTRAQSVEEPPIPVMIVCPYHEDSLRRAYEADLMLGGAGGRSMSDSVGLSAIRAAGEMSAQMERSFTFLYLLLALLALTSIAALRVAYRLKAEMQDMRHAQRAPLMSLPAPVVVNSSPLRPARKNPSRIKPARRSSKKGRTVRRNSTSR